jgi:hypothetical protein
MSSHSGETLRQIAIEIVANLPDNPREARIVLDYVRKLVDHFLYPNEQQPKEGSVVSLRSTPPASA